MTAAHILKALVLCLFVLLLGPPPLPAGTLEVRALLVPEREAVLASQINGRILRLPVEQGERFSQGQLLVELDCEILKAEREKARMDLEAAIETHEANLRLQEFGSASDLEVAVSSARRKRAEAEVLLAEARVKMCRIEAPFAGRMVKREANPHENVTPDQPLVEIVDDSRLKLHLLVPSDWLQWLGRGQRFLVRIDETGGEYRAEVTRLGARVNPVNQTLEVEAAFTRDYADLLAGMSGTALFTPPARTGMKN